jgi:signal transduction histidine kinase/CheY-like chemotaxis protein
MPFCLAKWCGAMLPPPGRACLGEISQVQLHAVSDGFIALACISIPCGMFFLVRKRRDLPYPGIFLLFGVLILAVGATHLLEVVTLWQPVPSLNSTLKLVTAGLSVAGAVVLLRVMPRVLALPGPNELLLQNTALEERVRDRTADLSTANDNLRREIAQRQQAEAEVLHLNTSLQRRLAEMKTLFDLLPVGVGIANDASCRDISMNPALARMLALPPGTNASLSAPPETAPKNFRVLSGDRLLHPEDQPMQVAARENRPVLNVEETIERADGAKLVVLINAVPLRDEHGRCHGCVATFQDISERQRADHHQRDLDRKLQETQKLESLGVLAGGIAHDFNNLLTGILGNASLARMDLPRTSVMLPIIEQIELATHRAADLCKQMLAYSGKGLFVVQRLDLNQLVEETTHLLNISISKNCVLRFNFASALPAVNADVTQLRQIIMNLVINASEAIGSRSGVIALSTGVVRVDQDYIATLLHPGGITPGDYVFLEVSDNGVGMDAATLEKIFDPFFTTKFTGRGLGLAAVLGIIRGHKGALKVYSEPGRGSTFKILLPCADGSAEATGSARPWADPRWRGRGTVLVVDDEETVRSVSARILEMLGFSVVLASDGREAIEKYREEPARFALVLLDLTMPHMDGEETFRQLRHLNPGVKVVLMSGFNEQEAVSRFTGKGLAGFVQKPFEMGSISAAVREVLING